MNIVILKNNLKEGLSILAGTKKENTQLPILKNFLCDIQEGVIRIISTDLELGIVHTLSGKVVEEGSTTIPFGIFSQIINNLSFERVSLETKDGSLHISTDNYNAKIGTMPKDDFPIIPSIEKKEANWFEIPAQIFIEGLLAVLPACQISEFRPELSGVLIHFKEGMMHMVATDSFRLARYTIPSKKIETRRTEDISIIVPLKTLQEVVRVYGAQKQDVLRMVFDDNQVVFENETTKILSRRIEGKFPDYEMVIPKSFGTEITVKKEDVISALKLISSLANRLHEVRFFITDNEKSIKMTSSSTESGESEYTVPAKISGQAMEISFNWRFVLDGLRSVKTENVFIGLNGEQKPSCIHAPDDDTCVYVVTSIKSG